MPKRTLCPLAAIILGLLTSAGASAQQTEEETAEEFQPQVTFHGFVEGLVYGNLYAGDDSPDNGPVEFAFHEAEVDVLASATERLDLRVDLNWRPGISAEDILEQAHFTYYRATDHEGLFMTFGRMNAPIGAEAVDSPDMLQSSHGLLFDYATATNVTGLSGGWTNGELTAQLMLLTDWEDFIVRDDISLAARLDYAFDNGAIGGIVQFDDVANAEDSGELTVDINASYAVDPVTFIIEGYLAYLTGDVIGVEDELAGGAMFKAHVNVAEPVALTARFSYLKRYANLHYRERAVGVPMPLPRGSAYHGLEATLAGLFEISENVRATAEFRIDKALDVDDRYDGGGSVNAGAFPTDAVRITPALELLAHF
jgi:hypothetical protein